MNRFNLWLQSTFDLSDATSLNLADTLIIFTLLYILRRLMISIVGRRVDDLTNRYRLRKTISYSIGVFGLLWIGQIWIHGFDSLATYLGLLSAGLAIALKDLIVNLAGFAFILSRRPFSVGDRIQVGEIAGDVIDLSPFQFTLMEIGNWVDADQSTGRIIHLPNGLALNQPVSNFTAEFRFIWNELPVTFTLESNWREAKKLLEALAEKHGSSAIAQAEKYQREGDHRYLIYYRTLTPIVYTKVVESGIQLTIRYLCDPRKRRGTTHDLWLDILESVENRPDIDFAYPTQRIQLSSDKV